MLWKSVMLILSCLVNIVQLDSLYSYEDYDSYQEVQYESGINFKIDCKQKNNINIKDYEESEEEEIENFNKPDFVTSGGLIVVSEGSKVVMPCQVNSLGGRQVV